MNKYTDGGKYIHVRDTVQGESTMDSDLGCEVKKGYSKRPTWKLNLKDKHERARWKVLGKDPELGGFHIF